MRITDRLSCLKKFPGFRPGFSAVAGVMTLFLVLLLTSCHSNTDITVYYGENSNASEKAVCEDLRLDLEQVTGAKVGIAKEPQMFPRRGYHILAGTPENSKFIEALINAGSLVMSDEDPGRQGGKIMVVPAGKTQLMILAGPGMQGMQNTVYDYCTRDLGVDPLSWWTGYKPGLQRDLNPYATIERTVQPPAIPIVCYFENDVDELANMQKPYLEYDMETWKGMINSLRRMHYNAVHIFDMFGRVEFYTRPGYKKIRPDYKVNLPLIDSMIDYAHLKGMKVQVDLSLGYQMKSITDDQALCWTKYRKDWIDTWVYYLTQTPLKKADIFSMRPRNQIWDRAYVSSCGEEKAKVFNEAFAALDSVLRIYKPDALKVCVCYDDGMELFNGGFSPPKDFIVAWSDDGYCNFKFMPVSNRGYPFGTYMHAGYWKNHTVHDPYPDKIDSVMSLMLKQYDAKAYLQVNGQTFRPFLLNLEAFGNFALNPDEFNGDRFYRDWCKHYFGDSASIFAVASMKALHEAQPGRSGYVQFLGEIRNLMGFLQDTLVVGPSRSHEVRFKNLPGQTMEERLKWSGRSLVLARQGLDLARDQEHFYYDYVYLPALMLNQLLEFENTLIQLAVLKNAISSSPLKNDVNFNPLLDQASALLDTVWETALRGDKYSKWSGWYDPLKRRPNNGFPTADMMRAVRNHLEWAEKERR